MLKKFLSCYLLALIGLILFKNVVAATAVPSCGVSKKCEPGFYCSGAVGESESGVCVANSLNVVMCRFTQYLQYDIVPYFFLLGGVYAGFLLFLGKFSMLTFVQAMLGIGILYGGTQFLAKITGSTKGLCTAEQASNCANETQTLSGIKNTDIIYNVSVASVNSKYVDRADSASSPETCGLLECFKAQCEDYTKTAIPGQPGKYQCDKKAYRIDVDSVKKSNVTVCSSDKDGSTLTVNCTPIKGSYTRDYFLCQSCAGKKFVAETDTSWGLKDCKDVVNKNIQ
jgi:hypothetical protein